MSGFIENNDREEHAYLSCDVEGCGWSMVADDEDLLALITEYYLHESREHTDRGGGNR